MFFIFFNPHVRDFSEHQKNKATGCNSFGQNPGFVFWNISLLYQIWFNMETWCPRNSLCIFCTFFCNSTVHTYSWYSTDNIYVTTDKKGLLILLRSFWRLASTKSRTYCIGPRNSIDIYRNWPWALQITWQFYLYLVFFPQ